MKHPKSTPLAWWRKHQARQADLITFRKYATIDPGPLPTHQLVTDTADMAALPKCTDCGGYDDLNEIGRCEPCQIAADVIERVLAEELATITMAKVPESDPVAEPEVVAAPPRPRSTRRRLPAPSVAAIHHIGSSETEQAAIDAAKGLLGGGSLAIAAAVFGFQEYVAAHKLVSEDAITRASLFLQYETEAHLAEQATAGTPVTA
jgi:hypothetical protein